MSMEDIKILFEKAETIRRQAYAPYSQFKVGACIESSSGKFYAGCNVENASYGLTTCAETNAIAAMIANGEKEIHQIAIVTDSRELVGPCGACRQRIHEFATSNTLIHLFTATGEVRTYTESKLLPHAFGPDSLKD